MINPKDSSIKIFNKRNTKKIEEHTYLVVTAAKSADRRGPTENIPLQVFHIPSTDPQIGTGKPKSNQLNKKCIGNFFLPTKKLHYYRRFQDLSVNESNQLLFCFQETNIQKYVYHSHCF